MYAATVLVALSVGQFGGIARPTSSGILYSQSGQLPPIATPFSPIANPGFQPTPQLNAATAIGPGGAAFSPAMVGGISQQIKAQTQDPTVMPKPFVKLPPRAKAAAGTKFIPIVH